MGLVQGEADVQNSKAFVNYGELVKKKIDGGGGGTSSDATKAEKPPEDKGQSDKAVNVPGETGGATGSTPTTTPPTPDTP